MIALNYNDDHDHDDDPGSRASAVARWSASGAAACGSITASVPCRRDGTVSGRDGGQVCRDVVGPGVRDSWGGREEP